ncbi:MAG: DUF2177 family protein [Saprospiraceae bacterium]|nr:DUF2177 family protein [Saprospiraceae bacterium]
MSLQLIISYLLTVVVFFLIDMIWLGVLAKDLYGNLLGHLMRDQINWGAALFFYLLFIVGIFIFAILPAVEKERVGHAILMGALFGLFTYATYELTNYATLKNWPIKLVIIDILWGAILTCLVSTAGYYINRYFTG